MNLSPKRAAVFGIVSPLKKRVLSAFAILLWALILLTSVGSLFEDAMRASPLFDSLWVIQGRFVSKGSCSGRGQLRGVDLVLSQGEASKSVRVPCIEAFSSLQPGAPLTIHFRVVKPLLSWPSFTDVWHVTSEGKVLYSYSARVTRSAENHWMHYALAVAALFFTGLLPWFLLTRVRRETEGIQHGKP
jgi:hypothetical protein